MQNPFASWRLCEKKIVSQSRKDAKRNRKIFAACLPTVGRPAVGRKEKRVGNNFKCHLLKEKMLTKVSLQLRRPLSF
jgi:hypothetical protein